MLADSSFDIVSKLDRQEVDNALNQAARRSAPGSTSQRRRVDRLVGRPRGQIRANSEERARAVLDVFKDKLVKRGVR